MIKAEVIAHDGIEVPNWVNKCKDVLTSTPAFGSVSVLIIAFLGTVLWHHQQKPALSNTGAQSQVSPSEQQLQVVLISPSLDAQSTSPSLQSNPDTPNASFPLNSNNSSSASPVGPAPTNSINRLQSANPTLQQPGGLTQAVNQTVQTAGNATQSLLNGIGL